MTQSKPKGGAVKPLPEAAMEAWMSLPPTAREANPLEKADIYRILTLESIAFAPKDSATVSGTGAMAPKTLDPPETYEGISQFMQSGGKVLLLQRDVSFLELMPLEKLMGMEYADLPGASPLKQIAEKRGLLARAAGAYLHTGTEAWYIHGMGSTFREVGDGKFLLTGMLARQVSRLASAQENLNGRIHFGYIDIGPEKENINVASLRLFFGVGAVIDGYEPEVYSPKVPYVRVSHGAGYVTDRLDAVRVDLSRNDYSSSIREMVESGYVGRGLNMDGMRRPESIVFERRCK